MNKNIKWLSIILLTQVMLFVFYLNQKNPTAAFTQTQYLLTLNTDTVDRMLLESGDETLEITKHNGKWVLPNTFDFPANTQKITKTVEQLTTIKRSLPVGNTMIAAKEFSVSEDKFEKKIELYSQNNKLQTLYIGDSPSFRKVYARADGEEHTFSVKFNSYDLPTKSQDWYDKSYFTLDRKNITTISLPKNISISGNDGEFSMTGLKKDQTTNMEMLNPILSEITDLSFKEVLSQDKMKTGASLLSYTVTTGEKDKITYQYFEFVQKKAPKKSATTKEDKKEEAPKENPDIILKASNSPYFVKIDRSQIARLIKLEKKTLIKTKEEDTASLEENKKKMQAKLDVEKGTMKR